jgi:hypothetical protein
MNRAENAVEDSSKSMRKLRDDASKKCSDAEKCAKEVDDARDDQEMRARGVGSHVGVELLGAVIDGQRDGNRL